MNKTCIITGANSGIGFETAKKLASNNYKIILAIRNKEKGEAAMNEIFNITGNKNIEIIKLDLNSVESIYKAAEEVKDLNGRLDILINNAGIYSTKYKQTDDGFESMYGINYLGHFLFTNLLLDLIKQTARRYSEARIINVSSYGYKMSRGLNFEKLILDKNDFSSRKAYGDSKLSLIYFTLELSRRFEKYGIISHALNPGTVSTNLVRSENVGKLYFQIVGKLMTLPIITISPSKAAETPYFLAVSEEASKYNGKYWEDKKIKELKVSVNVMEEAEKLWNKSKDILNLN